MAIKVRNINGTSGRKPQGHESWLKFWESNAQRPPVFCCCNNCVSLADVGAHVQEPGNDTSDKWYIVPLCYGCNKKTDSFTVNKEYLVPVTKND